MAKKLVPDKMKKTRFPYIAVMFLVSMLLSCHQASQDKAYLAEAEALSETEADSADIKLNLIDKRRLGREDMAKYALLRTIVDAKQGKQIQNDSLIRMAYTFYAKKSDIGESADSASVKSFVQASIYMGDWYAQQDSGIQSEDAYRTAIKYARKCGDSHSEYCTLSRLATSKAYTDAGQALDIIKEALTIYSKCKDSDVNYFSLLIDAANYSLLQAYSSNAGYDQAFEYAREAYELAKEKGIAECLDQSHILYANLYRVTKDYAKALGHIRQVANPSSVVRTILAECYQKCDSIPQARDQYVKALQSDDVETQYAAYKGLAELKLAQNERDSAMSYYDKAFECEESIYFKALETKEEYYEEILAKEKEKERAEYRLKLRTRLFLVSVVSFLLLAILVFWNLYLRIRMHKQKRQYLEKEREVLAQKMQQKEAMVRFLQNYIVERIDIIQEINKNKDSHVLLSKKDWFDIEQILNEIDNQSISKVRAEKPNFTEDDIRLCMLVRLRLSNSAIGNIYGISVSAVQHRKLKLKKDGFGETRPDITLEQAIVSI